MEGTILMAATPAERAAYAPFFTWNRRLIEWGREGWRLAAAGQAECAQR